MVRPWARGRVGPLLVCIWCVIAACKSVPTPAPTVMPERSVPRDTKLGWIARLEQERQFRDPRVPPAVLPTEGRANRFQPAVDPALDTLGLDADPVVRRRAVLAMGRVGATEFLAELTGALQDPDEEVRATAAFAIGLLGSEGKSAVPALQAAVADPALRVRVRAIDALGLLGDPGAVGAIYQAGSGCNTRMATLAPDDEEWPKAPEIEVCRAALFALVRLQNYDGIAGLVLNAQGQPVSAWWPVAYALQRVNDRRAVPALLMLATSPGVNTPSFALRGLASFKDPALVPIARAIAINREVDIKVRIAAARSLGQVGGPQGTVPLIELLGQPGLPRPLTLETLVALGASRYEPAFDAVVDFLGDPSPAIRSTAMSAAASISPEAFLVVLAGLEFDKDWVVRASLARTLGTLPADRVRVALHDLARDEDARVRAPALEALVAVKAPDISSQLFRALEAPDYVERLTAATLVGDVRPEGAVPRLVAAYDRGQSDAAYGARAAALAALAKFGGDDVRTILRRGLGDRDWPVRWRTAELLRGLGDATAAPERPARVHPPAEWFQSEALLHPAFSPHVFLETRAGTIEAELDVVNAAVTSKNFIDLARAGFFDAMKLHRVVPTFVIQGGDPRGDGEGGPGYTIPDELSWTPFVRGTIGMALDWRDTGGSQFFITLSPQPHLDGKYTSFGRVVGGWEVLDQLMPWDVIERVRVWDGVEFR